MKKILLIFVFIILYSLFFIHSVYAITETSGDLQISYDKPLFPPTTVWYPGLQIQRSFSIKNLGGGTHTTSLKAENTSQTGSLADNMYFRIDEGAVNRYGGVSDKTMKKFWDNGETNLSDIASGNTSSYTITIYMPAILGNEFQGKNAQFDLLVGFVGTESKITLSNTEAVTRITITPTLNFITSVVTQGFAPNVLGITTPSALLKPTGEIKGEKLQTKKKLNWLIVLLITIGGILFLRLFAPSRKK